MLRDHGRFPYSAIVNRPDWSWPDGRRLAVYVALNLEHFAYGTGLGISSSPGIPHPHEVNDIPMIALHHGPADAFARMIIDNFAEMLAQSRHQSLVFGIALHAFLVGQPYRLRSLRRAFEHLVSHRDDIWLATSGAIARSFAERVPAPGAERS